MLIKIKKSSDISENQVTDESVYLNRRQFVKGSALSLVTASVANSAFSAVKEGNALIPPKSIAASFSSIESTPYGLDEKVTPYDVATRYNNFYEFGYGKDDPAKLSGGFKTTPWTITVEGEAEVVGEFALDDLINENQLQERIYRFRCVEAWSMVIPWVGIPLSNILKKFKPTSNARYVYFETLYDPKQLPGQRGGNIEWPYREGLTIAEAMNSLSLLSVGMYGSILPNQNGAPVRLIVPWKYGFKSIKSIVKIHFLKEKPATTWNMLAPQEYGFYANVNPGVDHPRWSQKQERRLPGGFLLPNVVDTQLFNGYQEEVGSLYSGLDLTKNF